MPVTRRPFIESPSVLDPAPMRWAKELLSFVGADETPDVNTLIGMPMMAAGKGVSRRLLAKAGGRIAEGSSNAMGAEAKIPRFRSPLGTFVKHEGSWWRIGKQPADATRILLEKLPQGEELAYLQEAGEKIPVLDQRTVTADDLIKSAQQSNAANRRK